MKIKKINKTAIYDIIVILCIVVVEYIYFHNVIGTANLIGDSIDGRLIALISEHWYQFLCGNETLSELHGIFYPVENVLSYSDILMPIGIVSCAFRVFGVGAFSAFKYTIILVHLIGACGFYYHMRYQHKAGIVASFLSTVIFAFSGYMMTQNSQMLCATCLSFELIFLFNCFKSEKKHIRYINGILATLFLVLQFYNAFYIAYIFSLQFAIFLIVEIIILAINNRALLKKYLHRWIEFLMYVGLLVVSLIPFLILYLPTFNNSGGKKWEQVFVMPIDNLFYNGFDKFASEDAFSTINQGYCMTTYEGAFPLISFIIMIGIVILAMVFIVKKRQIKTNLFILSLIITSIIIFVFGISINGHTLWKLVYSFVPGASALRAQHRWLLVMLIPFSVLVGCCLKYLQIVFANKMYISIVIGILTVYVLFENVYLLGYTSLWNAHDAKNFEEYVAEPPSDCEIFYIVNGVSDIGNAYVMGSSLMTDSEKIQVDAMTIASKYHLKTINGYSGLKPEGWEVDCRDKNETQVQAKTWLEDNGISSEDVYEYDMTSNVWNKVEFVN